MSDTVVGTQPLRFLVSFLTLFALLATFSCSKMGTETHPVLPLGFIDSPKDGGAVHGTLAASGWALSEDGIESVGLYVDRVFATSANLGQPRPDVLKAYPDLKNDANPGWTASTDVSKLTAGYHELIVQARSKSGAVSDIGRLRVNVTKQ
jgi:hypothetical protein